MMISTRGRYALRILLDIAAHQNGGYVSLKESAERQGISKKYLEQIVTIDGVSRMLEAKGGKNGGYRLAGAPSNYTVGGILRAAEGSLSPVTCLEEDHIPCQRSAHCTVLPIWKGLDAVINGYLDDMTLQDVLDQTAGAAAKPIYLDNAATTKMSKTAIDAMTPYFDRIYGNPSSLHSAGQAAAEALADARRRIAHRIGAEPNEITFTSGGSEADNQAILSAAKNGEKIGKKHIVSTAIEHHAVLHTLKKLQKEGFEITLLPVGEDGIVRPEQVRQAIRGDTCLVTVMFANNEIGTIQPVKEIGAICRAAGVPFHTDAVQAAGHLRIDVKEQNIDLLSLSAHKFHGPKGIGVLYAKKGFRLHNLIEGGAQERGKRAGTENLPAVMGMAAALEEACENLDKNAKKMTALRDKLIANLSEIPHSILNGDAENRLPGNVNFCFEGIEGESLLLLLDDRGVCASSGSACTSGSLDPSHVLLAIGRPHEIAHGSLRLSLCEENTEEEIDAAIKAIKEVVALLRNMSPVWRDLIGGKKEFIIK